MRLVLAGISGPSSSGKSTVVKGLASVLPHCTEIHLDDFYLPDSQIPMDEKHGVQNWDCAEALDWSKFKEYLEAVRLSEGALLPVASLEIELDISLSEQQKKEFRSQIANSFPWLADCHVVLVDGFMLFHDAAVAALMDVKLLFRAPYLTLKERRELRQGYNTAEGFWTDPPGYFDNIVWPAFIASHKHLFKNGDVESSLGESATQMGIVDINNDGTTSFNELVMLTLESIAEAAKNN